MIGTHDGWNNQQCCRPVVDVDDTAVVTHRIEVSGQQDKGCQQLVFLGGDGVEDRSAQQRVE